jgi:DNA-binding transcriptional MocR family regulator
MSRTIAAPRIATLLGRFDRAPAYKGLAEGLRVLVTDGRIPAGTRLPSERDLTEALDVSRTTVARAYAELRDHGFLVSRQGSGSVTRLPGPLGEITHHVLHPGDSGTGAIDLTVAAPAPVPGMLAAYERAVAELPAHLHGSGYHPTGLPVLREAVAASYAARGLPTDPAQVLVVAGAQAGVATAVRALVTTGDRVVVESPTYPNAIAALRHSGARLAGVDVPPDAATSGADVDGLDAALQQVRPRVAYLVPDFHNPTGAVLSAGDRARLAATLACTRTVAVVDESLVGLALDGQRLPPPFAAFAPGTVSAGSLSKTHWGGLRVGWLRLPDELVDTVFRARLSLDLGVPPLEQLVGAAVLDDAGLLEHRLVQLRESRAALAEAIAEHLPDWRPNRPGGGLSLWCELPAPLSSALVPRAAQHGVLLAPGPSFAPEGGLDRFVRMPFGQPAHVLVEAVERIAVAWRETLAEPTLLTRSRPALVS